MGLKTQNAKTIQLEDLQRHIDSLITIRFDKNQSEIYILMASIVVYNDYYDKLSMPPPWRSG